MLFVLQLVLFGGAYANQLRQDAAMPDPAAIASFPFDTPANALTLMTGRERADQVAKAWDANARLVYASMQIDWPNGQPPETVTSISPFGWLRFVYLADIDGGRTDRATLSILIERVSGKLINQTVNQWTESFAEGDLFAQVTTSDTTAVLGTELGGGTDFRAACPKVRNRSIVSLVLDQSSGQPVWVIGYPGKNGDISTGMGFHVNAATGAVTVTRQPPSECPAS
jgi:hypothetical protein